MASKKQHHEEEDLLSSEEEETPKSTKLTSTLAGPFQIGELIWQSGETKEIEGLPTPKIQRWIDVGVLKVD